MRVNKIKMRLPENLDDVRLQVPIDLTFNPSDQSEVIEREFVSKEIENAVNTITDYEKVRFEPINNNGGIINKITYNVNLLKNGSFPSTTYYGDDDFDNEDIKYRKSRFKNSFLRLVFYDSDITTNQNVISLITLYSRLNGNDLDNNNIPKPANQIPIKFTIEEPVSTPDGESEGYHIYHNQKDVKKNIPDYLYMRASWNNASNSKTTALITDSTPQTIDNLTSKLHIRYVLTREDDGYYYNIDPTYSNNISAISSDEIKVELYEIQAI